MTEKEYRESTGISRSELWRLNPAAGGNPEKFMWQKENPQAPTQAMVFGTLVHLALLEPERFVYEFTFAPEVDRRTKDGKAAWEEVERNRGERVIVTKTDWAAANLMVSEVMKYPACKRLLDGEHEVALRWVDDVPGEECKIRADAIVHVGGTPIIVDYKTTTDASTDEFAKKAVNMGYDFQAGMYCEGFEKATGKRPRFVFIVQEKNEPYSVNVLEADEEFVQRGKDIFRELISIYHECKMSGNWWGYMGPDRSIGRLSLPVWAANK